MEGCHKLPTLNWLADFRSLINFIQSYQQIAGAPLPPSRFFFSAPVLNTQTHTKKGGHVFWVMKEAAFFLNWANKKSVRFFCPFGSDFSVPQKKRPRLGEFLRKENTGWRPRNFNLKPCTDSPKDHWVIGPWCKVQKTSWLRSFYGWIPLAPQVFEKHSSIQCMEVFFSHLVHLGSLQNKDCNFVMLESKCPCKKTRFQFKGLEKVPHGIDLPIFVDKLDQFD